MNHPSSRTRILDIENIDIKNRSRSKKNNRIGKIYFSSGKEKRGGNGLPAGPKCFECHEYGHFSHECVNVIKRKTNFKANIIKDDNIELDNSKEELLDNTNFIVFGVSLQSNFSEHESSDDSEDEERDEVESFQELREKYEMLYQESVKINETNLKLAAKHNNSNRELVIAKKQVINMLNAEIGNANILFERLNTGSKKLDNIFDAQRSTNDKSGLGYEGASSFNQYGGKINETKPKKVISKPPSISNIWDNVKKAHEINKIENKKFIPTCHYCQVKGHIRPHCMKLHVPKSSHTHLAYSHGYDIHMPTCHFCGVKGHIRPKCFQLHRYPPVARNHVNRNHVVHNKVVSKHNNVRKSWVSYTKHDNTRSMTGRNMTHGVQPNKQCNTSQVKTRLIWLRRSDLRPHADLSTNSLDDTDSSGGVDLAF
ncbi:hypothetical protein RHGRI_013571 [Rhododendron griersonianum]|uniref:CCHC-type domain-containing protein n=1 Tax=Rhododendron griersonianum TaxID=479676 RepID=A0AAV6K6K6_9ERIC|nr:hypothetical protein RHGRI_013571 [Rhododendron griersonianum]